MSGIKVAPLYARPCLCRGHNGIVVMNGILNVRRDAYSFKCRQRFAVFSLLMEQFVMTGAESICMGRKIFIMKKSYE